MKKETSIQSQNAAILAHFRKGKALTQMQAYDLFGCTRLSARVYDIRRKFEQENTGESIESVTVNFTARSGAPGHYSRYYLKKV